MKQYPLNNFQRQETARWLLNISQAAAVGGPGSYFVPGVSERIGAIGAIGSALIGLMLYLVAMYIGKEVKNAK